MEPCFHQFLFDLLSTTLTLKDFYQPLSCLLAAESALLFFSQLCGYFWFVCLVWFSVFWWYFLYLGDLHFFFQRLSTGYSLFSPGIGKQEETLHRDTEDKEICF